MKSFIYILEPITNLHVGNGDINYNIIDNEVERDINGYPVINASGIKGAFRQFIKNSKYKDKDVDFFGSVANNGNDKTKTPGKLKFYSGECLGITMRNQEGDSPYSLVTTKAMLKRFKEMNIIMKNKESEKWKEFIDDLKDGESYKVSENDLNVEGVKVCDKDEEISNAIYKFFKIFNPDTANNTVILPHKQFINIPLPVLARNKLENSISNNLWYEEYVPYHSLFFVCVSSEDNELINEFDIAVNGEIIQFGGNATIGYGLTRVTSIFKGGDNNEQKNNK